MTGGYTLKCVDELIVSLCKKLFIWLDQVVSTNEKYADASKIQNYAFFEDSVGSRKIVELENFVAQASRQREAAVGRYLEWMLNYEVPILVDIGSKVDLASTRLGNDSGGLELYVKRCVAQIYAGSHVNFNIKC